MTILEALNMIPDPEIRARAIRNRGNADKKLWEDQSVGDCGRAICQGFTWNESPEEYDFWDNVVEGRITTWQQACDKYPHLRELPMLSEEKDQEKHESEPTSNIRRYQIDFGNHLRCRIKVTDKGIEVEGAMNGWGDGVPLDQVVIADVNDDQKAE